jgi:hypothetical protein
VLFSVVDYAAPVAPLVRSRVPKDRVGLVARLGSKNPTSVTGFDVKHPLRTLAMNASIGRRAGLKGSRGEGPETEPQRPFRCEREMAFTGNALARVGTAVHERPVHAFSTDAQR